MTPTQISRALFVLSAGCAMAALLLNLKYDSTRWAWRNFWSAVVFAALGALVMP